MSLLRRFANLWRRSTLEREFDDELQFHFEMRVEANQRAGLSRPAAEDEARRHLRHLTAREGMRDARIILWIDELMRDLRQGARRFARDPGTTALAVLTLSLGIGANTVIFSLLHAVMFRALPFPDADRLVSLFDGSRIAAERGIPVTVPEWIDVRDGRHRFEGLTFYDTRDVQLTGGSEPARAYAARVEASFFSVLGVQAQLGRVLAAGENDPGRDRVVVLTDGLWRRTFGADPKIVGAAIQLNGAPMTVIGVMPPEFTFDYQVPEPIELFIPFTMDKYYTLRTSEFANIRRVTAIARLQPGASIADASRDVGATADAIAAAHPELYRRGTDGQAIGFYMDIEPLHSALTSRGRPVLLLLFGAVSLVLLVACVNTAQFLMARAMERRPEVAIRMSLGAGRARLLRQFLAEAFLLGAVAAIAGVLQALWLMRVMVAILPPTASPASVPRLDAPVLVFATVIAIVASLLFGLVPAWQFSRATSLRRVEQYATGGGRSRARQALIALEVGVSIVLLVVAALLFQTISRLQHAPAGYSADDITVLRLRAAPNRLGLKTTGALYQRYLNRIAQIPGVAAVAVADGPLAGRAGLEFTLEGRSNSPQQLTSYRMVSPGYFSTLQIPILQGRAFTSEDDPSHPPVAIINEAMARRYWPAENPIGRTIKAGPGPRLAQMTIVGIVGDVRPVLLDAATPQLYVSALQQSEPNAVLLVRTAPDAAVSVSAIKQAVWSVVPDQPLFDVRSLNDVLARQLAEPRSVGRLLGAFASLSLLMSAMGIYMIVTYLTSRRTKEVAVRRAVGAQTGDVVSALAGSTLRWSLAGLTIGMITAVTAARTLRGAPFFLTSIDPPTVAIMAVFYVSVIIVAMSVPIARAMRLDPSAILRAE